LRALVRLFTFVERRLAYAVLSSKRYSVICPIRNVFFCIFLVSH